MGNTICNYNATLYDPCHRHAWSMKSGKDHSLCSLMQVLEDWLVEMASIGQNSSYSTHNQ